MLEWEMKASLKGCAERVPQNPILYNYTFLERNQLPTDPNINKSFGFDKFPQPKDKRMLWGLYQDVALVVVDSSEMDQWRAEAD